jgi:hypothetical protein
MSDALQHSDNVRAVLHSLHMVCRAALLQLLAVLLKKLDPRGYDGPRTLF